jgi:hypothetical protein
VRKLNKLMREGEYNEAVFKQLTRKTLPELGKEWQESLRGKAGAISAPVEVGRAASPAPLVGAIRRGGWDVYDPWGPYVL